MKKGTCEICEEEKQINKNGLCRRCQKDVNNMDDMVSAIAGVFAMALIGMGCKQMIDTLQGKDTAE